MAENELPIPSSGGEYESETFAGLSLAGADLRDAKFIDCTFDRCALSSVKLDGAVMRAVIRNSKVEGINFFTAKRSLLNLEFENTLIRHSSFAELKMRSAKFIGCTLQNVDFADCDLTEADFSHSTFEDCVFQNTNLTRANFVTASGYQIDPTRNTVKKARFSIPDVVALLAGFGIEIE